MPEAFETIATRQRSEELFGVAPPLGAGACTTTPVRLVAGFSAIGIFGVSDQPFSVTVEGACSKDGPFAPTGTFLSSLDPVTFLQVLCVRVAPCAPHMRLVVCNTSATPSTVMDLCGTGIPKAATGEGGGAGTQGPQGPSGGGGGNQGPQGFQSWQGPQGEGMQGPQGAGGQGPQGPQSWQGHQGEGAQGPQGAGGQGPQGPQSWQGPQGSGAQGPQSFQGPQGPQSWQGPQGEGQQGPQSFQGPQSWQGPQGGGNQGPQGPQSWQGAQSFQGPQGSGSQGPQGTGAQGPQGPAGPQNVAIFSFTHTSGAASTGALGFTPRFAIYSGAVHRLVSTTNFQGHFVGFAIGTGAMAVAAAIAARQDGSTASTKSLGDDDAIGGSDIDVSTAGPFFATGFDTDLDVTAFGAGGIELTWSAAVTDHAGKLIVVG